jgi:hypothetical protein
MVELLESLLHINVELLDGWSEDVVGNYGASSSSLFLLFLLDDGKAVGLLVDGANNFPTSVVSLLRLILSSVSSFSMLLLATRRHN